MANAKVRTALDLYEKSEKLYKKAKENEEKLNNLVSTMDDAEFLEYNRLRPH